MVTSSGDPHMSCGLTRAGVRSARRSGECHRGCVVIGVSLRAARDGYKVWKASPGLWEDWGQV